MTESIQPKLDVKAEYLYALLERIKKRPLF